MAEFYATAAGYVRLKLALGLAAAAVSLGSMACFRRVRRLADARGPAEPAWRATFLTWRLLTMAVATLLLVVLAPAMLKFG